MLPCKHCWHSLPLTKTILADLTICVLLVIFASAPGKSSCSLQFPFPPPYFTHDPLKLLSRYSDYMVASGFLVFTELFNWLFLNKSLTSIVKCCIQIHLLEYMPLPINFFLD